MEKGHANSSQDILRNDLIQNLMCNLVLAEADIERLGELDDIKNKIEEFEKDGLLIKGSGQWTATDSGRRFLSPYKGFAKPTHFKLFNSAYHAGEKADSRMISEAQKRSISVPSISRKFIEEDFELFDRIIVMDDSNLKTLLSLILKSYSCIRFQNSHITAPILT